MRVCTCGKGKGGFSGFWDYKDFYRIFQILRKCVVSSLFSIFWTPLKAKRLLNRFRLVFNQVHAVIGIITYTVALYAVPKACPMDHVKANKLMGFRHCNENFLKFR